LIVAINNNYIPIKIEIDLQEGRDLYNNIAQITKPVTPSRGGISFIILDSNQQYLSTRGYGSHYSFDNVDQTILLDFLNKYSQIKETHNLGVVTIDEYNSFINNLEKPTTVEIKANIEKATIRSMSGGNIGQYSLTLDDGTSSLYVTYIGGLGNTNTGDIIDVELVFDGRLSENISPTPKIIKISKSDNINSQNIPKSNDDWSTDSTSGFGLITGIVVLLFIWGKMSHK